MNEDFENIPMKIEIEDISPDEVEEALMVRYKSWLATYPNEELGITREDIEERFKSKMTPESIKAQSEGVANLPENEKYLVAKVEGKIAGVCIAKKEEKNNRLGAIYTHPDFQGKGIGTKMWEEVQDFFDPEKDIVLNVASYNDNAIAFYEKLGFKTTDTVVDNHFVFQSGSSIPEIEMKKEVAK